MADENNNNNNNNNNNLSTSTSTGTSNSTSTNNNNSGSSDGPFSRLFHSMFHNNTNTNTNTNDTIQQQIHDELNREEERRKHRQEQQRHWAKQRDDFFSSGGLFGSGGSGSGSGSSGSIHKELEDMMEEMMNGGGIFGNTNGTNQNGGFSRSYIHQMRQEYSPNGVQISVSVPPGVKSANDLEVQVVQMEPSCVVQWNATTTTPTTTPAATRGHLHQQQQQQSEQQRVRLGSSVDCEQLSANLSRGMLKLSAPNKDNYSYNDASKNSMDTEPARSIPITELEHDDN